MGMQGPNYAGTVADDSGVGSTAWSNPTNAQGVADGSFATCTANTTSHRLKATNFGFSVPSNATITGIMVEIDRQAGASSGTTDLHVYLVLAGTVVSTGDHAVVPAWGTSLAFQSYGGITDLWSQTLGPSDVNSSGFGVSLQITGDSSHAASVDAIRITVYYTLPKDLITFARALDGLGNPTQGQANLTLSADEYRTLGDLITSVSDAVEKYCRRRFVTRAYDELYNGTGDRRLLLRQYPIQSVQSVRYRPVTVVKVGNSDSTNVQARVSVTSTGLKLFRFQSGASATDTTVTFATYPTLSQVVTAINALGHGWNAQVVGDSTNYGAWPSADLYWPNSYGDPLEGSGIQESQGALSTVVGSGAGSFAELKMHTYELQGYQWDPRGWLLRAIPYTDPELLHPEDLIFPVGINNFRIQYTAGYSTVPESVQEACSEWVSYLWWQTKRDPALLHQVPSSGTTLGWGELGQTLGRPPNRVASLLAPYRRHVVGVNQG